MGEFFRGLEIASKALAEAIKRSSWTLAGGAVGLGAVLLFFDQELIVASSITRSVLGLGAMSAGAVLGRDKDRRSLLALMEPPKMKALPPAPEEGYQKQSSG